MPARKIGDIRKVHQHSIRIHDKHRPQPVAQAMKALERGQFARVRKRSRRPAPGLRPEQHNTRSKRGDSSCRSERREAQDCDRVGNAVSRRATDSASTAKSAIQKRTCHVVVLRQSAKQAEGRCARLLVETRTRYRAASTELTAAARRISLFGNGARFRRSWYTVYRWPLHGPCGLASVASAARILHAGRKWRIPRSKNSPYSALTASRGVWLQSSPY